MATSQGMCKNCGSLIMFDDRDSTCECVFCHCVFPASEAVEILSNPEGRTFANEKFEANTDDRHHYTTRVYSTESLEKQIAREEIKKSKAAENTISSNEFEVTAKDVKAPKKLVLGMFAVILVIVIGIAAISVPSYFTRKKIMESLDKNFSSIYSGNLVTSEDDKGYSFYGQTCQTLNIVTDDEIDEAVAKTVFDNFCDQRAAAGKKGTKDVTVVIYCDGGIYKVTDAGADFEADAK